MKFARWIFAVTLMSAFGQGLALGAELGTPASKARYTRGWQLPRYVCNDYGRCWNSRLVTPEDYASGHLFLVNRVSRRAGYCLAYRFQYPVGWDECLGAWNYGRGRISH